DLDARAFLILLANSVHPTRGRSLERPRRALARDLALAEPEFLRSYVVRRIGLAFVLYAAVLALLNLRHRRLRGRFFPWLSLLTALPFLGLLLSVGVLLAYAALP